MQYDPAFETCPCETIDEHGTGACRPHDEVERCSCEESIALRHELARALRLVPRDARAATVVQAWGSGNGTD